MRYVHGFLTGLAAIMVIAWGAPQAYQWSAYWLQRWERLRNYNAVAEELVEKPGVPIDGSGSLRAFSEAYGEEMLGFVETADAVVVPIFYGENAGSFGRLELNAETDSKALRFFGGCYGTPIVNAAYVRAKTGEYELMLNQRAFLVGVGAARFDIGDVVVLMAVEQDSNGDGYLNCDDNARLEIYRPGGGGLARTDILFDATATSFRKPDARTIIAAVDTAGENGAKILKIFEIDVATAAVTELTPPNFTEKAMEAFGRIPNDSR